MKTLERKGRKWNEEKTDLLIDLLEQNGFLRDLFLKKYHLKDKREKAYAKMQELGIHIADIKYKIMPKRLEDICSKH